MASFEIAVRETLEKEGKFANHWADKGGKTMYGITEKVARDRGYTGKMKDLSKDTAIAIYREEYWDILNLDYVSSQTLANELFDTGVNCGVRTVGKWLQEDLNVLNLFGKRWRDLIEDGKVGPKTISVLNKALKYDKKVESRLYKLLNSDQTQRYKDLARRNESQEINMNGWLDKRVIFKTSDTDEVQIVRDVVRKLHELIDEIDKKK